MALLDSLGSLKPMTREEIEREQLRLSGRKREQSQRKIDSVPAGLALLVDALSDAYGGYQAGKAQKDNDAWGAQQLAGIMGGGTPAQPAPAPTGAPSPSGSQDEILARETRNNVPEEIRTGIASSAQALGIDPVDLATAISYETGGTFDPVKAGPTTQWGQHRGLIQFGEPQAKQYGVDWNNPIGSQLGPEGAVVKYLRDRGVKPGMGMMDVYSTINAGAPGLEGRSDANNGGSPGTVADKVNTQMAGHRQKAMALFGGQAAQPGAAVVGPADPATAPQQAPAVYQSTRGTDPRLAVEAAGQGMGAPPAPQPAAAGVAQALAQQPAAQQAAPQQSQAQLLALLQSGRLNKRDEGIVTLLLEQQMSQQQSAQKAAQQQAQQRSQFTWEQQQRQQDPRYQADLQRAQFDLQQAQRPQDYRQATPQEAQGYGATAGQFGPDGRFYPINPPSGMSLQTNPDGTVSFAQGPNAGKGLTEQQSKDAVFSTRAKGASANLNQFEGALTSPKDTIAAQFPFGNYAVSKEFQQGTQAGREWMTAILRKDTGAAITKEEDASYGKTYLPQPGDGPEVIAQKQQARARAEAALEAGMSPQAILNREKALEQDQKAKQEKALAASSGRVVKLGPDDKALFDSLPSGARFIDPDGKERVKP